MAYILMIGKISKVNQQRDERTLAEKTYTPTMKRNQVNPDFFIIYGMICKKTFFLHMEPFVIDVTL